MRFWIFICCLAAACVLSTRLSIAAKPLAGSARVGVSRATRSAWRDEEVHLQFGTNMEKTS